MKILKFKLLNDGRDGIVVDATEYINSGKYKITDKVQRTRKIPISDELEALIQKLKYYYLNLTGHWIPPYSNHYDDVNKKLLPVPSENPKAAHMMVKDIWNKTLITGARVESDGFLITGTIEAVDGKKIGIPTPVITEADDIGFFSDCRDVLYNIAEGISDYFKSHEISLEQAQKLLPEEAKTMTADELIEEAMKRFADRGGVIMIRDEADDQDEESTTVHTGTGNIDGASLKDAEDAGDGGVEEGMNENFKESDSGEEPIVDNTPGVDPTRQPAKSKQPFGPPAADIPADISGDIPTPKGAGSEDSNVGDLSHLEHSESMGIIEDVDDTTKQEDDW